MVSPAAASLSQDFTAEAAETAEIKCGDDSRINAE
jgi:hypothetical protein